MKRTFSPVLKKQSTIIGTGEMAQQSPSEDLAGLSSQHLHGDSEMSL